MTVEMRGAAFLSFFEGVAELRDQATADAVRDAVRADLRLRLETGAITRVGWYPMDDYAALHVALDQVVRGGDAFAIQLGRVTTDRDTRGLLRYVLAFTSPDLLLRYADKVAGSYVRGPTLKTEKLGTRHHVISWEGFLGATYAIHAEWQGGVQLLVERCGGKDVRVERRPGDDVTRPAFEVTWS